MVQVLVTVTFHKTQNTVRAETQTSRNSITFRNLSERLVIHDLYRESLNSVGKKCAGASIYACKGIRDVDDLSLMNIKQI